MEFAVFFERDPGVAFTELASLTHHETCRVAHTHELAPSPESEVHAVTRFRLLKLFGWLPVVPFLESVGVLVACGEEFAHFREIGAFAFQWLSEIPAHGERRAKATAPLGATGAKNLPALDIVKLGE